MKKLIVLLLLGLMVIYGCSDPVKPKEEDPVPPDKGAMVTLNVKEHSMGNAPHTANFIARLELKGVDAEDFYCVPLTWDFGVGDKLAVAPGCTEYEPGMEIERTFEQSHTYEKPGTYFATVTVKDVVSNKFTIIVR